MNNNLEDELCKSLFRLKYIRLSEISVEKIKDIKFDDSNNKSKNIDNLKIIHSDQSGVGKSTYIKRQSTGEYIYFPIGGIFSKENTLKRLQKLNKEKNINNKNNLLIHIDLYDTDQKSLMNDFLYFILFTKLYCQDDNMFYLSKKIKIYIEIPNSFFDFFQKFPILDLFPKNKKELLIDNLEPLIVQENFTSNIRIVSLYLKLLKEENELPKGANKLLKSNNKVDKNEIIFPFTPLDIILKGYNQIVIMAKDENKKLTSEICQKLIMEEIKNIEKPNYYQITSFIDFLANQLIQFNKNFALSACTIIDSGNFDNCELRSLIIRKFIEISIYFTKGAFTELKNEQKYLQDLLKNKYNEEQKKEKVNTILENCKHKFISFNDIDLALIFFHGGNNSDIFSIITNANTNKKVYIDLLNLRNLQAGKNIIKRIPSKENSMILETVKLNDYKNYKREEFLEELKSILDIENPIDKKDNEEKSKIKSLLEISKDYVFTADNFTKMCFILMRIRANIPVIMMGETGCGKTSLILELSKLQNNGDDKALVKYNIHAGRTNDDIIKFIEVNVIPKAKDLAEKEKNKELEEKKRCQEKKMTYKEKMDYEKKKLWVFFDELNTCKSMDLLSEIICKHSYQGENLPENIVFIGAVNPYRKAKQNRVGLKINKNDNIEETDLVYTVNPLPHSLLNFVFDFGALNPDDEKSYIINMIKEIIGENEKKLYKLATELILESQTFIREQNGNSSVSLREIRRFIIFYEFFLKYLRIRKEIIIEEKIKENNDIKYSELGDEKLKLYSINLSVYLGYYLRLTDFENMGKKGLRDILKEKLNKIFIKESKIDFLKVPKLEENFIADNVELEKGIAKNRALLENLFSLFVAINAKVPIFIIGKPGCSKSLSVQLINNAMKGPLSNNSFFRKYPKMYVSTYQGALNSTSEGVKAIFDKAREILEFSENKEKISTIYFDEMGLAEHSPHNPLKVIHSELEYDLNEGNKKVAFIGVSNWILDSSKMNRGITISIPDPNEDDIKTTSITIAQSYLGENIDNNIKTFFENLGSSYFNYKKIFKNNNIIRKYQDFHGNRDFFHLIKYPSTKIKEAQNKNQIINEQFLANLAINSLGRNFGGLIFDDPRFTTGLNIIIEKMSEYNNEVKIIKEDNSIIQNIEEKIMDNLLEPITDYLSRYLLLITKSNIGIYLLSSFLKSINKENNKYNNYTIFIGSMFFDDIQKEEYTSKILSKIKLIMEKDTILVLKDMDSIYPSLYDLFNQNFIKVKEKKYARIALGSKTNSFSEVNDNFRCVVLVDEDKIPEQEIPFLNRFEKQNLTFEFLMNNEQNEQAKKFYDKLQNMIEYDKNELKIIDYDIKQLLINCDKEEINGIIFIYSQQLKDEDINEDYLEDIFASKISVILPQDIILILLNNKKNWEQNQNLKSFYNKILEKYNQNHHNNIKSFLSNYKDEINNKIIIYTFTRIIESINPEFLESLNIKSLGLINKCNISEIRISSIHNEFYLEKEIEEFLETDDLKICFIKLTPYEYSAIDYLKIVIENKEKEFKIKKEKFIINKLFIFLVHLERIFNKDLENPYKENMEDIKKKRFNGALSNLAGYYQIFIDDIKGKDYLDSGKILTLDRMMKMKNKDLFNIFLKGKIILENLYSSLCYFDFSFVNQRNFNKIKYINKLIELFDKDNHLIKIIDDLIISSINSKCNDNGKEFNIFEKIIKEESFTKGDICILDIIKKYLTKYYINEFKILYVELEKENYFSSLINNYKEYIDNENNKIFFNNIKEKFIENINLNNKKVENELKLEINIDYNLPFKNLLKKIDDYILSIKDQFRENEEQFKMNNFEPNEFEEAKQKYENKISFLNNDLQRKITEDIIKIMGSKLDQGVKIKFYNLLFKDYILYFINKYYKEEKDFNINDIKSLIEMILDNKFKINNIQIDLKIISSTLIWIESYSMEILLIIKFYNYISMFIKGKLLEKIRNEIILLNNQYDNLEIDKNIIIVNRVFYIILASLIKVFISNLSDILSPIKDIENYNFLINNLKNIYYNLLSLNNNMYLNCKEIYLFHQTIKIISILSYDHDECEIEKEKKTLIEFIQKKIINEKEGKKEIILKKPKIECNNENIEKDNNENKETKDLDEEKILKEKYDNFYKFYKGKKDLNFYKLFSSIIIDEFNKEFNENYRKFIFENILNDDNLIQPCILIIKMAIAVYLKPDKEIMEDALIYINSEETYFPILNDCKKEIVKKNIMKIFDSIINLYFDSFEKLEDAIITELFKIFKEYLLTLENKNYEKYYENYYNENLIKMYSICFIKIYLKKFIYLLCDKRTSLKGYEKYIIEEICKNSNANSISNTLKIYIIILLSKKNSLFLLKDPIFEKINNIYDELKTQTSEIIIPKEGKYPFNEYFTYIEYPSFDDFKNKFISLEENKEKYPLLLQYIKDEQGPKKLKYLNEYNDFVNFMIYYYSGGITRSEAKLDRYLDSENISKDKNFKNKFNKFQNIWNKYLSNEIKKVIGETNSDKFKEKFIGNEKLAYFLNDDDEKGYGIFISYGLQLFIEWQNSFLKPIINSYKSKKNNLLNCYISHLEKSIDVQNANTLQILQIDECFDNTPYINFDELINIYVERNPENINDFIYDFDKIEEELGEKLLPNKCLFNEKNIKYIIYQNEGFRNINSDFLIKFAKIYGEKELDDKDKENIYNYISKNYNNFHVLYDSFILLVNFLIDDYLEKKDTKICIFIDKIKKKYINFSRQFLDFFNDKGKGKDINFNKLLNSILYMEDLCFYFLKDNINIKYKSFLEEEQKKNIEEYFNLKHKDEIITKKEISSAVRRYITRFLLDDNKKEDVDPDLELYKCLERQYLWSNKIFSEIKDNFKELIKQYIGEPSFSLKVRNVLEFYNIIGKEDMNLLEEERKKFIENKEENNENLDIKETKQKVYKVTQLAHKKIVIKGLKKK